MAQVKEGHGDDQGVLKDALKSSQKLSGMIKTVCFGNMASHEDAIKWIRFIIEQTCGLIMEERIAAGILTVDDLKSIFEL